MPRAQLFGQCGIVNFNLPEFDETRLTFHLLFLIFHDLLFIKHETLKEISVSITLDFFMEKPELALQHDLVSARFL